MDKKGNVTNISEEAEELFSIVDKDVTSDIQGIIKIFEDNPGMSGEDILDKAGLIAHIDD